MKSSNIGGQAVMEGIMMKNKDEYAVAVRKSNGEIELKKETYHSVFEKCSSLTKIPFIRGVFNFIDSMVLGMSTLMFSASFFEEEEETKPGHQLDMGSEGEQRGKEDPSFPFGGLDGW